MAVIEKRGERIDIRPTTPASGNDLIRDDWHRIFHIVE